MPTRPLAALAAAALVAPLLAGCDEPLQPVSDKKTLLGAAGDYTQWARPKNREERQPIIAPHGAFVDIYINEVVVTDLAMVLEDGLPEWSEGATIVLAGYDMMEAGALQQVALMQKRHGVWQWEQYDDASDLPRYSGRPDVCVGCHSAGEDFVRSFTLPDPPPDE
jgi:hypothetical protein